MDVKELLSRVGENLSVSRSFGAAYKKDGLLIIPVAMVAGGGGGGGSENSSSHSHPNELEGLLEDARPREEVPNGSGGGFGGVVLPVGAYVVKGEEVTWVPAVNVTLIALAALGVLRLLIRSATRRRRRRPA
ncbi:MAG TPA: spore germination protein GerW family protein [Acidimicrobiales bacterium]|nr:spore germination protein GerW family protein [Acidimicrobiales bacterium]